MATTKSKYKKSTRRNGRGVKQRRKSSIHASRLDPQMAEQFPDWFAEVNQKWGPTPLGRLLNAKAGHPLLWGTEGLETDARLRNSLADLDRSLRVATSRSVGTNGATTNGQPRRDPWMASFDPIRDEVTAALDCLAAAHALPSQLATLEPAAWEEHFARLVRVADEAQQRGRYADVWCAQLFAAELPITLGYLFGSCEPGRRMGTLGSSYLQDSLDHLVDRTGALSDVRAERYVPLLACWTRCLGMLNAGTHLKLKKPVRRTFGRYLTFVLRTLRHGSVGVFETDLHRQEREARTDLFRTAKRLAESAVADVLIDHHRTGRAVRDKKLPKLRMLVGDEARIALLQSDWTKESARLLVDFSQPHVMIELSHRSQVLLRGTWQPALVVDSEELTRPGPWTVLFSYSDADVDVLEIEQPLARGWRLQRQFVLGKQDAFLFTADVLLGPRERALRYELALPLTGELHVESAADTRECWLHDQRRRAMLLPLAAPEWRRETSPAELHVDDNTCKYLRHETGRLLFAPLFVDFHPRRILTECTWRRLTVAENLQRVPADKAVGYRVQSGLEQWLFYRSFTEFGNRSVLGQNLSSEFYCGRFLRDGTTESLIEVERESSDDRTAADSSES